MAIDWTKIYKKYKGRWLALEQDETTVIAAAVTAREALAGAKAKGYSNPILTKMPEELSAYVG